MSEIDALDICSCDPEGDKGYVLEVDLEYPAHLHDMHNDYCLAPDRLLPTNEMLSPYQRDLKQKLSLPKNSTPKLIPNLLPKTKYIVHFRNLQLYIKYGMALTKVHRVTEFHQERWLKPYIDFNTEKRKAAKTPVEKNNYKFLVNAIFGRSCMNLRKQKDVKIIFSDKQAKRLVAKPNFSHVQIINPDLVVVNMRKTHITWSKPTYLGFSVLEVSKRTMYDFHHGYIVPRYSVRR